MVICDLKEYLEENDYYKGVPALIVEVLSENMRSKGFGGRKFGEKPYVIGFNGLYYTKSKDITIK